MKPDRGPEGALPATIPRVCFPADATAISDTPKLTLVVMDPEAEWTGSADDVRERIAQWTRARGASPRLYPGALVWAVRKPGRELRDKVEQWLAWKRVAHEVSTGALGSELDSAEVADVRTKVAEAGDAAREEVWGGYRFMAIADASTPDGLAVVDLGAGHSSSGDSLCGRVISALKSSGLLNESVGAGYLERNWPPALKEEGVWPLASLRQSFLNGALTRLVEPDTVLRRRIVEFVGKGDFGLGSGRRPDNSFGRVWFKETLDPEDVAFESDVHLLTSTLAERLKVPSGSAPTTSDQPEAGSHNSNGEARDPEREPVGPIGLEPAPSSESVERHSVRIQGQIPPESWNRIGTRLLPKLRARRELKVGVTFELSADKRETAALLADIRQVLDDLQITSGISMEVK